MKTIIIALVLLLLVGCATIPQEVIDLSYTMEQDLYAIHTSYKTLVREHFKNLRYNAVNFINTEWGPAYLEFFIEDTELLLTLQESGDSTETYEYLQVWIEVAVEEIEAKKLELIEPINQDEQEIMLMVDDAFARLYLANSTVTAHLNSIRKVRQAQDEVIGEMGLGELQSSINSKLTDASIKSKDAIDILRKAEDATGGIDVK